MTRLNTPRSRPGTARAAGAGAVAVACVLVALCVAGCASVDVPGPVVTAGTATTARPSVPLPSAVRLQGEPARAAAAVARLSGALRAGDVEGLCEPGVIFTGAVIADMAADGTTCEASDEVSGMLAHPPALTVVSLGFRPDLATAQVSVGGRVVPLDIVRDGRRWLISFSRGVEPLDALDP